MPTSSAVGTHFFANHRTINSSTLQVIPIDFIVFFNKWEVRGLILLSLGLQILLIGLGHRRKYKHKLWIRIILWCAYMMADWVAIVSLGTITKNTMDRCQRWRTSEDPFNQLQWFWAQFLLVHLGGADTITAYSLEDNELWLRQLLALVVQTGLASYILLVSLPGSSNWLGIMTLLIFMVGLIKYYERLAALSSANSENFRDSMLPEPDAGPNYTKFMEEYVRKQAEGFYVEAKAVDIPVANHRSCPEDCKKLIYDLYLTFKCLFVDAILSFEDRDNSKSYFGPLSAKQAFKVVEIELGFAFDEFYTKASMVCKYWGLLRRGFTFFATLFSLLAFTFLCDKDEYKAIDLVITYLLLIVAILLEMYSLWILINSDWTHTWIHGRETKIRWSGIVQRLQKTDKKRWSNKMAQYNLLDKCLEEKSKIPKFIMRIMRPFRISYYIDRHWHMTHIDVLPLLEDHIWQVLKNDKGILGDRKGSFAVKTTYANMSLGWAIEGEFDKRILLWHIATHICCSIGGGSNSGENDPLQKLSKWMSNYMLYLLVVCPFMLPAGIGMRRFRDTCAEVEEFLGNRKEGHLLNETVCNKLVEVSSQVDANKVKGDRSKSVLFDACKLAKILGAHKDKWKIISEVWVEMLAYAAGHCRGNHHASQLRKGGELLTHVWLLMAHLGITEQLQISQGHARAKLITK